ncbi:MAG: translational GTPase TypA [Phycisphaeraceae bacterium]|nr:translational GTPase TypA [Phycisphaeraceae bacterium]
MPPPPTATTASSLRNVAVIAHVDHGKTTLVDQLLKQSGNFRAGELEKLAGGQHDLIMDSNPLERERGITILSKNCAVQYTSLEGRPYRINIIDTPGHADFGGEVERVLRMADGCLLIVDAFDGPMPQTKFVLTKALEAGLKPVVVINKCDRPNARPDQVVDEVFDLLVELGADDHALDFQIVYASGRNGWATLDLDAPGTDLRPLFEKIIAEVPSPDQDGECDPEAPLQMLVTTLDYNEYVGRIAIGRIFNGSIRPSMPIVMIKRDGTLKPAKTLKVLRFVGLGRQEAESVSAGDLCAVVGLEGVDIGDTIASPESPVALPTVTVDEPTISMTFRINDSPFAGQEGQFVTSRQIRDRLMRELEHNVALRVEPGRTSDEFLVSGRGILHLGILLENMRREGYELSVGRPQVILKEINGELCEPLETLVVDVPNEAVGSVMEVVGARKGELKKMEARGDTISHLVFEITSRALIGLRGRLLTASQGEAIVHHRFDRFVPVGGERPERQNGVLIALESGPVTAYAVEQLADRGVMFVIPGDKVYSGQIVGEHNRDNDLTVNITRLKHLTNIRAASKEATVTLKAPRRLGLEAALEYIEDDELVELTPTSVRLRKRLLDESARRKADRQARQAAEDRA